MGQLLFCSSVKGLMHYEKGTEKEDYCLKYYDEENDVSYFILGDGHGDSNCPRSNIGSEYICNVALEELKKFYNKLQANCADFLSLDENSQNVIVHKLIYSIKSRWDEKVCRHFDDNSLTEEELKGCTRDGEHYKRHELIEHIYGTTMIAGVMSKNMLLILHQGDGQCVVFDENGNASRPVPWDEQCVQNICTSICQEDAAFRCRYLVRDLKVNPITACFIGSDGVEDSVKEELDDDFERLYVYYRKLTIEALKLQSEKDFESYLNEELDRLNRIGSVYHYGSHDDTTVCGIILTDKMARCVKSFERINEKFMLNINIDIKKERIEPLKQKHDYLLQKKQEMALELTTKKQALEKRRLMEQINDICESSDEKKIVIKGEKAIQYIKELLRASFDKNLMKIDPQEVEKLSAEYEKVEKDYSECLQKYNQTINDVEDYKVRLEELNMIDDDNKE